MSGPRESPRFRVRRAERTRAAPALSPIPASVARAFAPRAGARGGTAGAARSARAGVPGGAALLAGALAAAYALLFLAVAARRLAAFAFDDQDLALHTQALWSVLHGSTQISILGVSFLGNHLHFATFALAPLYAAFPSPMLLLTLQTFALAAAASPLFRIAERRLGGGLALAVVAAYLLYPALGYVNLAEFHMPALAVPLLFAAHLAYEEDRRGRLALWLVAVALVQENLAVIGAIYGALLVVRRRDVRLGAPLALGMAAYFVVALEVLLPLFWRDLPAADVGVAESSGLFGALGNSVPKLALSFARDPLGALARAYSTEKGAWLAHLVAPLAGLPLLGIEWLGPAVPSILQHYFSLRASETLVTSHYNAELIPFLAIAAVAGLARARRVAPPPTLGALLVAAAVAANLWLGCQLRLARDLASPRPSPLRAVRASLVDMVPANASVVATFDVLPHLANRARLYTIDHVARGTYTVSTRPYRLPRDARYALVDWDDDVTFREAASGRLDENLARAFADGSWRVLYAVENIALLHRAGAAPAVSSDAAFEVGAAPFAGDAQLFRRHAPLSDGAPPAAKIRLDGALELLDARVVPEAALSGDRIRVALAWRLVAPAERPYRVRVEIVDTAGRPRAAVSHPICYNIFPPTRWADGEIVREDVWLPAPTSLPAGDYGIAVRVDRLGAEGAVAFERISDGVIVANNRAIVGAWRKPAAPAPARPTGAR